MADEQIIVNVQAVGADELIRLKKSLADTRIEAKQLDQAFKDGTVDEAAYKKQAAELVVTEVKLKPSLSEVTASLKTQNQETVLGLGSLKQMQAQLTQLNREYANLSKVERESAAGKGLQTKIKDLHDSLKGEREAIGQFQMNVGNYKSAVQGVGGALSGLKGDAEVLSKINNIAQKGIGSFANLATAAGPVGIAIAAIGPIAEGVIGVLGKFDGVFDTLQSKFAGFKASSSVYFAAVKKNLDSFFSKSDIDTKLSENGEKIAQITRILMEQQTKAATARIDAIYKEVGYEKLATLSKEEQLAITERVLYLLQQPMTHP